MPSPAPRSQHEILRIGFDAKRLFAGSGGLQSYARTLLLNLLKYYPTYKYFLYTPAVKDQRVYKEFSKYVQVSIKQSSGLSATYWRSKSIVKDLVLDGIDIYHGLSGELPIGIRAAGIKSVVTIHDLLWHEFPNDYTSFDRKINDWKLSGATNQTDVIVAVSDQTKDRVVARAPGLNVQVINPVAAPEFYRLSDRDEAKLILEKYGIEERYILAVGNAKGRKNISQFVQHIRPVIGDIPILLIGKKNDGTKGLKLLSDIAYADMPAIYRSAIACVYPSLGEGYGLPIAESIISGIPVVVHDAPPMNAFDSPLCLSCEVQDAESAQQAMKQAMKLRSSVPDQVQPGEREQQRYADAFMDVYHGLLV